MSRRPGAQTQRSALRARLVAAPDQTDRPRHWPPSVTQVIDPPTSRPADEEQAWRPVRVHGGPGSGKTALIVDAAVARLLDPSTDPESVLVLASSRRAAVALREEITRRVLSAGSSGRRVLGGALREPLVRTVHSYAFAILRLQAQAHNNPPPRLITGSEQDVVLRELLAGDIEDGAGYWPSHLRPALGTDGFAQALRDLMMRAAERGVGPEELAALGRTHKRPEWIAAARAYAQYEQNMLLRGAVGLETPGASAPAVDAAELIGSALSAFATDPELLSGERRRIRHLLVDDAQHLDPQAAQLITLVGAGTLSTIIAADTDQSVFGFRGASPRFADGLAEPGSPHDILLEDDFRARPELSRLGRAIAARLPGARPHPYPRPVADTDVQEPDAPGRTPTDGGGAAAVRVYGSAAKEATAIADLLRRAHLFDGVPWSQMAVVVRSVSLALPPLRRAFRSAGVPLTTPASDLPLHRQRAVIGLMLVLRAVAARTAPGAAAEPSDPGTPDPAPSAPEPSTSAPFTTDLFTTEDTLTLLSGPIGAADPGAMRRLRRGVRRLDDADDPAGQPDSLTSLTRAILDPDVGARYRRRLTETEAAPLARVLDVVGAAQRVHDARRGIEETLWAAWQATGLERRWAASAVRGGPAGEQADRDLDAVMAMFESAADFSDTLPAAGPAGFVHYLSQLQIPRDTRTATATTDSVTVLSAHAAVGREWEVVAVAGVQDGLWPSLRSRGGVLQTGQLVDILDGMAADAVDTVARGATALADERRLFLVACTRARGRLLVTAVEDGSGDASPSRFITELADLVGDADDPAESARAEIRLDPGVDRVLSLPSLVATLRSAVIAGADEPDAPRTEAAARLLAELADSDIPGAHPRDWFGLAAPSTDEPLWTPESGALTLSPSNVDALTRCSLRWVLERNGGRDGDGTPALTGSLVHTLVQAVAGQLDPAEVTAALRGIWERVDTGAGWYSARELERAESMLGHFREWLRISRTELEEVGVELPVDATIPADPRSESDEPAVRLRGRVDRLETDADGRPVVVDVKTSKNPITKADADEHAQMAAYQVALAHGGVPQFGDAAPGGARLVYVSTANRNSGAAERVQLPLTPELLDEWIGVVRRAARASIGPTYTATPNPGCVHCNLTTSCPAQIPGKAVTDD
ncbi:Superfamily I DNA and RNA helicase [Gordonia terrae C-6]|uniref:DNA 3'-5' helicase n=1 Tax=Gordonia terrae C-6 TaxID=1316928 RepID=R7Y610_9ACTN|nr:ATP-dependent DNA helicase [Gordonia terrae]EON31435.1 Superfamily I DNA and RNA helicase [Gordonia terrae C-6]